MANSRPLRIVTILTFIPAFPLLLAHGIVSHQPCPAVGLAPLFVSSSVGLWIVVRHRKRRQHVVVEETGQTTSEQGRQGQGQGQGQGQEEDADDDDHDEDNKARASPHRLLVFGIDVILAAALMVVLVFTWTRKSRRADMAMLAAYSTIPLMVNL
jgi:hypothetical protein